MLKTIIMFLILIIFLLPYHWMLTYSFEPATAAMDPKPRLLPKTVTFDNYLYMFRLKWFPRWVFNSILIPGMAVILTCLSASMAGYVLAKKRFPGGHFIFLLMIATMAIPANTILVPRFLVMKNLGLLNTYPSMFLIYMAKPFGVFLMKQIISTIPDEIMEAGMIDGASEWQIYRRLIVPMAMPGIIALGMFTFVACYGDYFWQLLMTKTISMRTLPLAIEYFRQGTDISTYTPKLQLIMAAALLASLPLLVLYGLFHKYFIEGPSLGSIK